MENSETRTEQTNRAMSMVVAITELLPSYDYDVEAMRSDGLSPTRYLDQLPAADLAALVDATRAFKSSHGYEELSAARPAWRAAKSAAAATIVDRWNA